MLKHEFISMTVNCEVTIHGLKDADAKTVAEKIQQQTLVLEQKYNFYNSDSWLNTAVNQRDTQIVEIDQECFLILSIVRDLSVKTQGCFDITVGTIKSVDKQDNEPREAVKAKNQLQMGLQAWQLLQQDERYFIQFNNPLCRFDLGGVIKEYAVDKALAVIRSQAKGGLINFGGDIACWGAKENAKPFTIAVKNPLNPTEMLFSVELENQALTTSGHYERKQVIQGKDYSHIIGEVKPDILQTTVVAETALEAGIYSTALTIKPDIALPDSMGKVMVDKDLVLHQ